MARHARHEGCEDGRAAEIRAAYFGHSAEVDREYYTDLTDTSSFVAAMMEHDGD